MYRLIVIALLLTGCAIQNNKPIADDDRALVDNTIVVSTLSDDLDCSFVGLTVFNNNKNTYKLDYKFNQNLTSIISTRLNSMGMEAIPLPRDTVSFIDESIGAKSWDNIQLSDLPEITNKVSSIVILDGQHQYNSTGGYYARDNALTTAATLYVYDVSAGRLIGKSKSQISRLKRSFSCAQEAIPDSEYMLELIDESGREILDVVFEDLLGRIRDS